MWEVAREFGFVWFGEKKTALYRGGESGERGTRPFSLVSSHWANGNG